MTLYLKYRPKNLDELDSESVRESLKKIFSSGEIPHAFLFAGPKGIGKTSAARIMAMILNCETKKTPCGKCEQCASIINGSNIDVIELDAASHRGIDDIRALREVVKLSPAKAKKKVYIIDEAHMLTTEASNALLKTLEEPPSHVVFVLATTNPEKLIGTIKSRTTEIIFKKADLKEIEHSLERAIKGEKIKIDKETVGMIASRANGSFRDAVKILEQWTLEGKAFLGRTLSSDVVDFAELLINHNREVLLSDIKKRVDAGLSIEDFIKDILLNLQDRLLTRAGDKKEVISLIELMLEASKQISDSPIEELPLEIAVIKWCQPKPDPPRADGGTKEPVKMNGENIDESAWKSILTAVRPINASIEALLRSAKPIGFDGKTLTLGVFYKFHKERLEEVHHRKILEDVITQIVGGAVRVSCILEEPPAKVEPVLTESEDNDIIKAAEEIFGV
ncbi:MAG: polymerase III gamma and tau protein [Candidatus Woesebacteria bacterium GW2011_GWB1_41_10]|uniref:DNA polymerase III subunit gamma/tau n=1 Tax=Candidatus Woesebacteria bacterium GW2011_GWB1_41_10 TaxID=1618577 RepID=A0A0G0XF27_9BACT|nr:MAG: polymerase III gamma and tau protein [Candidatus Woesebacteria bacterium GW2011_GWB1_41_10]